MIKRFFLYSMLGIYFEVFWTGLRSGILGDFRLQGRSSIIMMLIYGSVVLLEPLFSFLQNWSVITRGIIYSLLILSAEYFLGLFLLKLNICPWNYSKALFNYASVTRIDYMPLWIIVGLGYERLYFMFLQNNNN